MARTKTVCLAVGLGLIGPPMFYYGLLLNLAWYPPIRSLGFGVTDLLGRILIAAGVGAVVVTFWLAGRLFHAAPALSGVAFLAPIVPILVWYLSLR